MTKDFEFKIDEEYLLDQENPVIFSDGSGVFNILKDKFKTHKEGFFILAPSGAGKTYFVSKQEKNDWIDGDYLWQLTKAHPRGAWWLNGDKAINEIDQRSDIITAQAKKLGFWILGASNYWLKPDAIVIPNWKIHKKFIILREKNNYDGGATSNDFSQVLSHRKFIMKWQKQGVPKFNSVENAVNFLVKENKVKEKGR